MRKDSDVGRRCDEARQVQDAVLGQGDDFHHKVVRVTRDV